MSCHPEGGDDGRRDDRRSSRREDVHALMPPAASVTQSTTKALDASRRGVLHGQEQRWLDIQFDGDPVVGEPAGLIRQASLEPNDVPAVGANVHSNAPARRVCACNPFQRLIVAAEHVDEHHRGAGKLEPSDARVGLADFFEFIRPVQILLAHRMDGIARLGFDRDHAQVLLIEQETAPLRRQLRHRFAGVIQARLAESGH